MAKHPQTASMSQDEANAIAPVFNPAEPLALGSSVRKIADLEVTLPVRWIAGMVMTEKSALAVQTLYERQFNSNMTANLENARKVLADDKATAESKAKAQTYVNAFNADYLATQFISYEPNIGRTDFAGSMEKLRNEAAWLAFITLVSDHNKSVKSGAEPVVAKWGAAEVTIPKGAKDGAIAAMLANPTYAERIQVELDKLVAAKNGSKSAGKAKAATADLTAL